jgi:hypothetical protein
VCSSDLLNQATDDVQMYAYMYGGFGDADYEGAMLALATYGVDDGTGVIISYWEGQSGIGGWTRSASEVSFTQKAFAAPDLFGSLIAHEGVHLYYVQSGRRVDPYWPEFDAYSVQTFVQSLRIQSVIATMNLTGPMEYWVPDDAGRRHEFWCIYFPRGLESQLRTNAIDAFITLPKAAGGRYGYPRPNRR